MNYVIDITAKAQNDLCGIFEYIAFNLQSPGSAERFLERLERNIASLNRIPERFRLYEKEPWRSRNLRIMPVGRYLVFYIPRHDKGVVTIIRIMYSRRDTDKILNEIP